MMKCWMEYGRMILHDASNIILEEVAMVMEQGPKVTQLVKAFHGILRASTAFTTAQVWSLY